MITLALLAALTSPLESLEACIQNQMKSQMIPGMVVHVRQGKKTILRKAYGVSNLEQKTPTTLDDRFEMGSIGKSFTAAVILKLAGRKLLSLEDSILKHLLEAPLTWSNIKVKNLLSQTSGLPDYAFQEKLAFDQVYTVEDWKKIMFRQTVEFRPGQIFAYSNTNFVMLGLIIERVTKQPYLDVVRKEIFEPFAMTSVQYRKGAEGVLPRAEGYYKEESKLDPAGAGVGAPVPSDGGGFCTVDDLFRYGDAFLAGKVVAPSWVKKATHPYRSNGREFAYGYGWFTKEEDGVRVVEHDGNGIGYSASLSYYPKQGVSVAVMCNVYPVIASDLARTIAAAYDGSLRERPAVAASKDPHPETTAWLLDALKVLAGGKLDSPKFHDDLVASYSTGRGQLGLGGLAKYKDIASMSFVDEKKVGPDRAVRYLLAKGEILRFFLEPGGKLIRLQRKRNPE